jgi:dTDP-4-amino-4,6-dideoxygalactose transaminase
MGYAVGDCPKAERLARETLALPIYPELTEKLLERVVQTIKEFYKS